MDDGRLPKDILYGELALGKLVGSVGRPNLLYKDVCKHDLKDLKMDILYSRYNNMGRTSKGKRNLENNIGK
jgi:hypothetical protein